MRWIQLNCSSLMKIFTLSKQKQPKQLTSPHNKTSTVFGIEAGVCRFTNIVTIEKRVEDNPLFNDCLTKPLHDISDLKIQVVNKVCKAGREGLEKVTIIKFNNESVLINDTYNFVGNSQDSAKNHSKSKKSRKKEQLFKKNKNHTTGTFQIGRKVTKNLAKNFIKAFVHYLREKEPKSLPKSLQYKILRINDKRCNNSTIKKIISDEDIKLHFKEFLEHHAQPWIEHSKIKDKELHADTISVFQAMIDEHAKVQHETNSHQAFSIKENDEVSQKLEDLDNISVIADEGNSFLSN